MSEHANTREKRLAALAVAVVVLVTVLLIVETFRLLLPGLWSAFSAGDEQALSAYLTSQGRLRSFLTLWFLAVVQVLSLVIPAMPVQLAAGLAYGPWLGFVTSFSASAVANLTVFLAARRLAPVIRRLTADNAKATKRAEQRAQQQRPVVLHDPCVHHTGPAQRHHPLRRRQRRHAAEAFYRRHLYQPALSHPADLRRRQLYSGGELAVHGSCRRGSVQLCGHPVLQPHKAHRTRARPQKQAYQKAEA